ncbi:DUF3368 domain-containing protein [Anabaena sp. UHCC 0204]|nr:DUF3368 domain-containing protein [Anabaena sp. UHCC 0204]
MFCSKVNKPNYSHNLAKKRGLIPTISPGIQALRDAGLWLSDSIVDISR